MKRSVLLAVLLATAAPAQNSATIYGTISDAGGAVVPGAAVTVIHVDTGTSRKSTTDIAGGYVGNVNERVEVEAQVSQVETRRGGVSEVIELMMLKDPRKLGRHVDLAGTGSLDARQPFELAVDSS